jgi:ubiquinone/menaquinone biosynthesis C-methylase UbiE
LRGRRVLEVAHGTGHLLLDLVGLGFEPVGLDLSLSMSRLAARKLRRVLNGDALPVL